MHDDSETPPTSGEKFNLGRLDQVVNANDLSGNVIKLALSSSKDNHVSNNVNKVLADDIVERLKVSPDLPRETVNEALDPKEENHLSENYRDFSLNFTGKVVNGHGLLAATRKLNERVLLNKTGYSQLTHDERLEICKNENKKVYVKDVGGNFNYHLNRRHSDVHSCNPELSPKDCMRRTERKLQVNLAYTRFPNDPVVKQYHDDILALDETRNVSSITSCRRRSQYCPITARTMTQNDSGYDMTLPDLAASMASANCDILYGTMMFIPEILLYPSGEFPEIGVRWEHQDKNGRPLSESLTMGGNCHLPSELKRKSKKILFKFVHDHSQNYVHNTAVYLSYFLCTRFYSPDKRHFYMIELLENRAGYQFYKVVNLGPQDFATFFSNPVVNHTLWLQTFENKYMIRYYTIDHEQLDKGCKRIYPHETKTKPSVMKRVSFLADKELVDDAMDFAHGITEQKFKVEEIFNFIKSLSKRLPQGEIVRAVRSSLDSQQKKWLAGAIYATIFKEKYDQGKINQQILADVHHSRSLQETSDCALVTHYLTFGILCSNPPKNMISNPSSFQRCRKYFFKKNSTLTANEIHVKLPSDNITITTFDSFFARNFHHYLAGRVLPPQILDPTSELVRRSPLNLNGMVIDCLHNVYKLDVSPVDNTAIAHNDDSNKGYIKLAVNTVTDLIAPINEKYFITGPPEFGTSSQISCDDPIADFVSVSSCDEAPYDPVAEDVWSVTDVDTINSLAGATPENAPSILRETHGLFHRTVSNYVTDHSTVLIVHPPAGATIAKSTVLNSKKIESYPNTLNSDHEGNINCPIEKRILTEKYKKSFDKITSLWFYFLDVSTLESSKEYVEFFFTSTLTVNRLTVVFSPELIRKLIPTFRYILSVMTLVQMDRNDDYDDNYGEVTAVFAPGEGCLAMLSSLVVYSDDSNTIITRKLIAIGSSSPIKTTRIASDTSDSDTVASTSEDIFVDTVPDVRSADPIPQTKTCLVPANLLSLFDHVLPNVDHDENVTPEQFKYLFFSEVVKVLPPLEQGHASDHMKFSTSTLSRFGSCKAIKPMHSNCTSQDSVYLCIKTSEDLNAYLSLLSNDPHSMSETVLIFPRCFDLPYSDMLKLSTMLRTVPLQANMMKHCGSMSCCSLAVYVSSTTKTTSSLIVQLQEFLDELADEITNDPLPNPLQDSPPSCPLVVTINGVDITTTVSPGCDSMGTVAFSKGDGNCCYYAIMENRNVNVDRLRQRIKSFKPNDVTLVEECDGLGGTTAIEVYCAIYSVAVTVYDTVHDVTITMSPKNPLRTIHVRFTPNHYDYVLPTCTVPCDPSVSNPICDEFQPLCLQTLRKFIYTTKKIVPIPTLQEAIASPTESLVNNLSVYCNNHVPCINNNFGHLVDLVLSSGKEITGVFETKNFSSALAQDYLTGKAVEFDLSCLPKRFDGYFLITLRPNGSPNLRADIRIIFKTLLVHASTCAICKDPRATKIRPKYLSERLYSYCNTIAGVSGSDSDCDDSTVVHLVPRLGDYHLFKRSGLDLYFPVSVTNDKFIANMSSLLTEISDRLGKAMYRKIILDPDIFVNLKGVTDLLSRKASCLTIYDNKRCPYGPDYVAGVDTKSNTVNCMIEARHLWNSQSTTVAQNVALDHSMGLACTRGGTIPVIKDISYGMLDLQTCKWVIQPARVETYQCAFDGEGIINIEGLIVSGRITNVLVKSKSRFISVNRDMKLMIADQLYNSVKHIKSKDIDPKFEIEVLEGCPGAGKTSHILDNHDFHSPDHLVVTTTRESANDLRRRAGRKYNVDPTTLTRKYCTLDSLLISTNRKSITCKVLWVDEGLMRHCGEWLWAAYLLKTERVIVMGDSAQIPYIERTEKNKLYYSLYNDNVAAVVKTMEISHRIPADIAYWLNHSSSYSFKVRTSNDTLRSTKTVTINNLSDIPSSTREEQCLCYTQAEKYEMIKAGFNKVSTVHEYQGNQSDIINLVRINPKKITLYESKPHILVALTRHTAQFIYWTVSSADNTVMATQIISSAPSSELEKLIVHRNVGGGIKYVSQEARPFRSTVIFDNPKSLVLYREEKSLRDFVQLNGETGFVPACPVHHPLPVLIPPITLTISDVPLYDICQPSYTIQTFIDLVFPGSSVEDNTYDQYIHDINFTDYNHPELLLKKNYACFKHEHDQFVSVIRSSVTRPVSLTQPTLVKAFLARNGNVPQLNSVTNRTETVNRMMNRFERSYIADLDLYNRFKHNALNINVESIRKWTKTQPPKIEKVLAESELPIWDRTDHEVYTYVLKRIAKIDLELGAEFRNKSPQTIAHQTKEVNAVFCPIVKDIKDRLMSVLRPDVLLNIDLAPDDLEDKMSMEFPPSANKNKKFLEIDFSKYDKSQNLLTLLFELKILKNFGFPPDMLELWTYMHRRTVLINRSVRFKAIVDYQRKSGDAMTYLGNTLFLMAVMADIFDVHSIPDRYCLFSGDDSLIFTDDAIPDLDDKVLKCAYIYNLEAKLLRFDTPYFCSRFLISYENRWYFMPDALKMAIKLGRKDMVDYEHVEMYRISLLDNMKNFKYHDLYQPMSDALNDRYSVKLDFSMLITSLLIVSISKDNFATLYKPNPLATPKIFSTKPNLDI